MQGLRSRRAGNIAIIMAFAISCTMFFAALAIDVNYVRTSQFELHNAADVAAHAALLELRRSGNTSAATALATQVAGLNTVAGAPVTMQPSNFTYGFWDYDTSSFTANAPNPNSVQVQANRRGGSIDGPIRLLIGPVVGYDSLNASAHATGAFRFRDIIVVQDITSSFIQEMNDAILADRVFLDNLYARHFPYDRVGMWTFTGGAASYTTLQYLDTAYSSIRARWWGDGKSNLDATKASGLTDCFTTYQTVWTRDRRGRWVSSSVALKGSWMQACSLGGGGTNQGSGIKAAADELIAKSTAANVKVIVLVSDGEPTSGSQTAAWRRAYGVSMADYAYANDISVFTVSMNTAANAVQRAYMASLIRGYGKAYDTSVSTDLSGILRDIAASIPVALVE